MTNETGQGGAMIIPGLRYTDAPAAVEWLCAAFGFEKHLVVPGAEGKIAHAQLTYRNSMIMLGSGGERPYDSLFIQPAEIGAVTQATYVIVDDVDAHCTQARDAGAEIVIRADRSGLWRPALYVPRSRAARVELRLVQPVDRPRPLISTFGANCSLRLPPADRGGCGRACS